MIFKAFEWLSPFSVNHPDIKALIVLIYLSVCYSDQGEKERTCAVNDFESEKTLGLKLNHCDIATRGRQLQ